MGKKRKTIGILYQPSKNWIAGAYYLQNIVSALKSFCSDDCLPRIIVFCNNKEDFNEFKITTDYPLLTCQLINQKPHKIVRVLRKAIKKITGIRIKSPGIKKSVLKNVRFIYPVNYINFITDKKKLLAWIPDFQEKYYPNYFSSEENEARKAWQKELISEKIPIVFSSHDAQSDLLKFYPDATGIKTYVLPFTVKHPDFSDENIDDLKNKYGITRRYLFCANQFWIHKNHMVLFHAMNLIKAKGCDMQLVCSGALHDHRTNTYHSDIINYIEQNNLSDTIKILGFIERTEQLCLMQNAYAIVQPSLFEGWSTVVEDAKRLNKFIFLSDLNVHLEQNPANVCFFDPNNEEELAEKIQQTVITEKSVDYQDNVILSGKAFWEIINDF